MDVANLTSDFRLLSWGTDTNQLSDANALVLWNKIYRQAINKIKSKVSEKFFYDYWTVNTPVIWQSEYRLPVRDDTLWVAWCTQLIWVSAKFTSNDTEFTKFRPDDQANMTNDMLYYSDNQSSADPFYTVADNSYFVYPAPTEVISAWIVLYWIADPAQLLSGWDEESIKLPLEYHDIIPLWMVYLYYKSRNLISEKNDALNEYNLFMNTMIQELSDRIVVPLESKMPSLIHLS